MKEFLALHNRTVTRTEIEAVIQAAKEQQNTAVIYRLSRILNAHPSTNSFVINIRQYPETQGLSGAQHTGDYREALDENGRLKKGWKFSNGQIVSTHPSDDEITFLAAAGIDYLPEAPDDEPQGLGKPVPAADIYKMVTDKVISMFKDAKISDYKRAWKDDQFFIPLNYDSKKPYRGVNRLLLEENIGIIGSFANPYFLTFKQIKKHGGKLKKGSKGYEVIYYSFIYSVPAAPNRKALKTTEVADVIAHLQKYNLPDSVVKRVPLLRYYRVFNGKDVEGIDFKLQEVKIGRAVPDNAPENQAAQSIVENYPNAPEIKHGGNSAHYAPVKDYVQMPNASNFDSANDYYRTLFHELIHSTGHPSRLNRELNTNHKSEAYAKEELTAEMGAVFLSAWAGILWYNNKNHAAYLKSWNNAIKEAENDSKFIMRAAAAAQKATDHILNLDANGQPAFLKKLQGTKNTKNTKNNKEKNDSIEGINLENLIKDFNSLLNQIKKENKDIAPEEVEDFLYHFGLSYYDEKETPYYFFQKNDIGILSDYKKHPFFVFLKKKNIISEYKLTPRGKKVAKEFKKSFKELQNHKLLQRYSLNEFWWQLKRASDKSEPSDSSSNKNTPKTPKSKTPKPQSSLYEAFSELLSQIKSTNADIPSNELEDFLYNFGSQHYIEKENIYTFFYDKVTKPIGSLSAYKKHPLFTKVKNPQPHHAGYTTTKRGTEVLNIFIKDFEALKQQYDYNHYSFTKFWNIATEKPKPKAPEKAVTALNFSDVKANRQMIESYRNSSTGKISLLKTDMIGTQFHLSMFEKYMAIDDIAALYGKGRKEEAQKDYAFVKERIERAFNHHLRAAKEYNTIEQCTERFIELLPDLLAKGGQWLEAKALNKKTATAKGKFTKTYKQTSDEIASIAVGANGNSSSKKNTPKKAPRAAQYTGVKTIPLSDLYTDEKRFQNRKKLNEEIVDNIVKNFKPTDLDPLVVWYDKKQDKTFVLAGHHRFEALKRLKHKTVPVKYANEDYPTEADAIRYAKEISNANRTLEEPYERAAIYRKYREEGYSEKDINEKAALEGKNRSYILNLSWLNSKGATMSTLVQFSQTQSKADKNEAERIADWIGQARRNAPELTDAHEKEMFDFLTNKEASKRTTNKAKFLEYVRACYNPFEPTEPLNLARIKYQSEGEKQYDEEVEELKSNINKLQGNITDIKDRFINPNNPQYIKPTAPDYLAIKQIADNKIAEYNTQIQYYQKKLFEVYQNKKNYIKPTGQMALFGKYPEIDTKSFKDMKVSELRAFTLSYYLTHLKGKKVAIKNQLKEVIFTTKAGRKIAKGEAMYKEKAAVIERLEELIKNSTYNNWGSRKTQDSPNILGYLNFKSKLTIDGEKRHVRIAISLTRERKTELKNVEVGKKKSASFRKATVVNPQDGRNETLSTNIPAKTVPNSLNLPDTPNLAAKMVALQARNWESFKIANPQMQRFLGDVELKESESTVITIGGGAGSGKTRFAFQFINALAQNYKVGHASLEEHPDSKLYYDKVKQYLDPTAMANVEAPEIKNLQQLDELIQRNEVIVIDSFAKLRELDSRFMLDRDLRKKYNSKLFLLIYQLTGEGKMRGGSESEFDGDIILLTHVSPDYRENYIYPKKNRYNALPATQLRYSTYYQQMLPTEDTLSGIKEASNNTYEIVY